MLNALPALWVGRKRRLPVLYEVRSGRTQPPIMARPPPEASAIVSPGAWIASRRFVRLGMKLPRVESLRSASR